MCLRYAFAQKVLERCALATNGSEELVPLVDTFEAKLCINFWYQSTILGPIEC